MLSNKKFEWEKLLKFVGIFKFLSLFVKQQQNVIFIRVPNYVLDVFKQRFNGDFVPFLFTHLDGP